ncbi:MAG: hypothetical protein WAW80_01740 [Candidatus Saccharimonadales bacterium]
MNNQLVVILDPLRKIISKYHALLFFAVIALSFAFAIYSLNDVLSLSNTTTEKVSSNISGFDQKTIDKIKNLHGSNDTADSVVFPTPRSNPFVEK